MSLPPATPARLLTRRSPVVHLRACAASRAAAPLTLPQLAFIIFCFLLSMGNRPAGSKWGYTLSMVVFAVVTLYMTVSASP